MKTKKLWILESGAYFTDKGNIVLAAETKSALLRWIKAEYPNYVRNKEGRSKDEIYFENDGERRWLRCRENEKCPLIIESNNKHCSSWLPIDYAPKDELILVYVAPEENIILSGLHIAIWFKGWKIEYTGESINPTHWMRLPDIPQEKVYHHEKELDKEKE